MQKTNKDDILFDDVAVLRNRSGKAHLDNDREIVANRECANYIGVPNDAEFRSAADNYTVIGQTAEK